MRSILIIIFCSLLISENLFAQQFAGEEKSACGATGATIGVDNPNPEWCYIWEVADGMDPADKNSTNPLVKPNFTTIYRCTVTDQNFSFKATDQVKVKVAFGGITFAPNFVLPDASMNQTLATLTLDESLSGGGDPGSFTWSIGSDPDNTGCSIDPVSGWISNCSQGGTVTIKATRDNNPACKAEKDLEVNIGVKDVIARDNTNSGREAKSGDTLYLVGSGSVEFEAVPNDGATFPDGQPEWSGDLTPASSGAIVWSTDVSVGTYVVTAGDKSITVIRKLPNPNTLSLVINLKPLDTLKKKLESFQPTNAFSNPLCSPIPIGVTFSNSITIGRTQSNVFKYQDPGFGNKVNYSLTGPAIGAAGCVPLPCCFVAFGIPNVGQGFAFVFAKAGAGITFAINTTKDPSTANGEDYMGSASLTGTISMGMGAAADVSIGPLGLLAVTDISTSAALEGRIVSTGIEWQARWGGLQAGFLPTVYWGEPSNAITSISLGPYSIINGGMTEWSVLKSFD